MASDILVLIRHKCLTKLTIGRQNVVICIGELKTTYSVLKDAVQ